MKRLIVFTVMMLAVLSAAAQTINGTWSYTDNAKDKVEEQGARGDIEMTSHVRFRFNGEAFSQKVTAVATIKFKSKDKDGNPEEVDFVIEITCTHSGTLAYDGSTLVLTPAKGQKPKVEVTTNMDDMPGGGIIKTMVVGPVKKSIISELKEVQNYKVLSLTDTELTLQDILTEKQIKKGVKSQTVVLNRQ
ncbi:MAG: hypothetical protein J5693_05205 [Bacteroidales bacterium]|nr:hypothetical protein [Bacteroidales bacterium]